MTERTTMNRKGSIDNKEVTFNVTSKFNDKNICGAEGHFITPGDVSQLYGGTTKTLIDKETGNTFDIHVADNRFTFFTYVNIDKLF